MIELVLLILIPITNGTGEDDDDWISDDNSTISGCDYYGGSNLRLHCPEYCPKNYYGDHESALQDLLLRDPRCS
jgi:hypothetical protein